MFNQSQRAIFQHLLLSLSLSLSLSPSLSLGYETSR